MSMGLPPTHPTRQERVDRIFKTMEVATMILGFYLSGEHFGLVVLLGVFGLMAFGGYCFDRGRKHKG